MKKRRLIFFAIFGVYHLIILIFTSYIDAQKQDFGVLTSLYSYLHLFKYGAALGLVLLAIDFIWSWRINILTNRESESLNFEINNLKAKVYDLQEASKPKSDTKLDSE
ncbi:MAG TPA: hypothetical protein VIS49_05330 [Cyclobacteriaceae bacterium]